MLDTLFQKKIKNFKKTLSALFLKLSAAYNFLYSGKFNHFTI